MDEVHKLDRRRTHELDLSLKADLFEVTTKEGRSYIGIQFEQKLTDGRVREFRSDLERLEFIEKKASAYAESGDKSERYGQVGDTRLRLKRGAVQDRSEEVVTVQLLQKDRSGSEEWQALTTQDDKLKAAVHEGQKLEHELGYTQRWHVLVDPLSLTRDERGRIHAQAVRSFESEEKAREALGKSSGLVLYGEPQRREFSKGDTIELWADADILVRGQQFARSVEHQLGKAEWSRERMGEHYIVARWDDASRAPVVDQMATWKGTGQEVNGDPEDFRIGPTPLPGRQRGKVGEPVWVLIERDPDEAGLGKIRAISHERQEMTTELGRLEGERRAVGRDFDKQAFGMDRKQFTQGYSM